MFSIFKKKDKGQTTASDRYFKLKIREVRRETADTNTIVFDTPDRPLNYLPGQFLTLILPIDKKEVRRSYSFSSCPYSDPYPAITVKRVDAGTVSNYLHDHMKPGDVFDVMEPNGHFVPALDEGAKKKYVMFAAGSGITPMFSIIKTLLLKESGSSITLIYQNRNEDGIIFRNDLANLEKDKARQLKVIHVLSQPLGDSVGIAGKIDLVMATTLVKDLAGNDPNAFEYYLCGPSGFMHAVQDALASLHVSDNHIHKESFYSGESKPKHDVKAVQGNQAFTVKVLLDGQSYQVDVPAKKTILEAALDQGIDFPFSCQSGLCTACRGKLLEGEVNMEEDEGLTPDEKAKGYILNCVSKPKGPGVVVEVG